MFIVNSCIGNGYDNRRITGLKVPRLRGVYIGIIGSTGLAGVIQTPQLRKHRIIGNGKQLVLVVRLGVQNVGRLVEPDKSLRNRRALRQLYYSKARRNLTIFFFYLCPGKDKI